VGFESSFARLTSAFNASVGRPTPRAGTPRASGFAPTSPPPLASGDGELVHIASLSVQRHLVCEPAPGGQRPELVQWSPASAFELFERAQLEPPRVLILDVELCAVFGPGAIHRVRRMLPDTEWLLAWDTPSVRWVDTIIQTQAVGCIDWGISPHELRRALETVLQGEMWFPRPVMQSLYTSLLSTLGSESAPGTASPGLGPALTAREAEVLALMHQGLTNKEIGARLEISANTVKKHLASAFDKRGLKSRRQAFA
jgi:DNA-binding NarL/FixJ family response regulator